MILSYKHTEMVSSNKVDGFIYDMVLDIYDEYKDQIDPDIRDDPQIYFLLMKHVFAGKKNFSDPSRVFLPELL